MVHRVRGSASPITGPSPPACEPPRLQGTEPPSLTIGFSPVGIEPDSALTTGKNPVKFGAETFGVILCAWTGQDHIHLATRPSDHRRHRSAPLCAAQASSSAVIACLCLTSSADGQAPISTIAAMILWIASSIVTPRPPYP